MGPYRKAFGTAKASSLTLVMCAACTIQVGVTLRVRSMIGYMRTSRDSIWSQWCTSDDTLL